MQEKFHFQAKGMPLIKFQDADKIKSLQSGKIYAKTLGYYRKREETGDCCQAGSRAPAGYFQGCRRETSCHACRFR